MAWETKGGCTMSAVLGWAPVFVGDTSCGRVFPVSNWSELHSEMQAAAVALAPLVCLAKGGSKGGDELVFRRRADGFAGCAAGRAHICGGLHTIACTCNLTGGASKGGGGKGGGGSAQSGAKSGSSKTT